MARPELFSSRWAIVAAGLGMAVGTGNLWRFPRVAAENGGGAFLIPWALFLVLWSLPLLIAEFGLGRGARRGPIGAFAAFLGRRRAWLGGFVVVTTTMIMFYYSVVTGWTLKYFLASVAGDLGPDAAAYWSEYSTSVGQPILFHVAALAIGALIVSRGVAGGIERANRVLIPTLFVLLLAAAARAVTLDGAGRGLAFLFQPDLAALASHRTWLEALTQSAWSTGAGWGLLLTYAIYVRREENVARSAAAIGIGNNVASLLAAMAILPAAFAMLPASEAREALAAGNVGLTFVWIPRLFELVPAGRIFLPVFFLALFCAALSSLIAMIELATRALMDGGLARRAAVRVVAGAGIVCGVPSAVSIAVFENQDWVWGLALMISGLFMSLAVTGYGQARFRAELVDLGPASGWVGQAFEWVLKYLVPVEFAAMFGWWTYQAVAVYDAAEWWNPLRVYSLGTCLLQWGAALLLLWLGNRRLAAAGAR